MNLRSNVQCALEQGTHLKNASVKLLSGQFSETGSISVTGFKCVNVEAILYLNLFCIIPNRKLCSEMGEQVHVLYRQCFWAGHLSV